MKRQTVLWVVLAVLGLLVAAGVTAAASRLSSQHVGLSSEPISAGSQLVPEPRRSSAEQRKRVRPAPRPQPHDDQRHHDGDGDGDDD